MCVCVCVCVCVCESERDWHFFTKGHLLNPAKKRPQECMPTQANFTLASYAAHVTSKRTVLVLMLTLCTFIWYLRPATDPHT